MHSAISRCRPALARVAWPVRSTLLKSQAYYARRVPVVQAYTTSTEPSKLSTETGGLQSGEPVAQQQPADPPMENVVTPEVTIEPVHTPKVPDDTTEKVPDDTTEKVPTTEKMPNDTTEAYLSDKVKKSKKAKKKVKKKVVRVDLGALHKDFDDEEFEEFGDQFVEDEFKV